MSLTETVLRAKLASIQKKEGPSRKRYIGFLSAGWLGPEEIRVNDEPFRVVFCSSSLAVREKLDELNGDGPRTVIVTDCRDEHLGADVQARVFRNKFQTVDPWQTVLELFQATRLGPGVPQESWLHRELTASLDSRPALAAGTVLDLETVKEVVFRRLGFDRGRPDVRSVLEWTEKADAVGLADRDEGMRQHVRQWIEDSAGKAGVALLDCVQAGHGQLAVALGLVFRVVAEDTPGQGSLRREVLARAEQYVGQRQLTVELEPWASAAEDLLRQRLDTGQACQPLLDVADDVLDQLRAEPLAERSRFLKAGLRHREQRFATALAKALHDRQQDLAPLEQAARAVAEHELARIERRRAIPAAVEMATRLLRWLRRVGADASSSAANFRSVALAYVAEGSFVDWAREMTTLGYPHEELQKVLRELWLEARNRRQVDNQRFAEQCSQWMAAPTTYDELVPLEQVLDRVVGPLAAQGPVLFLVLDGMSLSVFHELASDLPRFGWTEIGPCGEAEIGTRRYGVAALPTVTEVSRTSLLTGCVKSGGQDVERNGFEKHVALRHKGRPRLFHKDGLSGDRLGLAPEVVEALRSRADVVGVVINAIDDWLGKGDQDAAPWDVERIRPLVSLLDMAAQTDRLLVVTSDHGHVRDHESRVQQHDDGTRYRRPGTVGDGEILVKGPRVCFDGGAVVLPWDEVVRYKTPRQNGYHGGITPQEVLVPLAVFARAGREQDIEGYAETPPALPEWWEGTLPALVTTPAPAVRRKRPAARRKPTQISQLPFAGREEDWLEDLLASELFKAQKELAKRGYPGDDKIEALLMAVVRKGNTMTLMALANQLNLPPLRLKGLLTVVRRVLNVDGIEGIEFDANSQTVRVHVDTLRRQFGLDEENKT